jgi:hypothetical protein
MNKLIFFLFLNNYNRKDVMSYLKYFCIKIKCIKVKTLLDLMYTRKIVNYYLIKNIKKRPKWFEAKINLN